MLSNKWLSSLKILSLGVGIAAGLLLTVYINWQWSFDRKHSNGDNIVRINAVKSAENRQYPFSALTVSGMAVWAKNSFPEVKNYVRIARWIANDVVLRNENIVMRDENFLFVDSTFFDVFDFEFIEGDRATALNNPNSILLTSSKAKAFFGSQSALGKTILFDGRKPFLVTGVLKDVALESHIQFSALCPMSTIQSYGMEMYQDNHFELASKSKPLNVSRILGARRKDIWQQLITSASVSNILGILLGLILTQICLPILSSVFNLPVKSLFEFHFSFNSPAFFMILIIGLGILATSFLYTFLLSSTNVIAFLNRQEKTNNYKLTLRKSLIVFQFSIIVALIAFGLLINKQTVFMKEMPVEINLDNVQVIRSPLGFQSKNDQKEHFEYFYQEVKKLPAIESVGFSRAIPGQNLSPFENTLFKGKNFSNRIYRNYVVKDLFETYKYTFLSQSPDFISPTKDLQYAAVNENAMKVLGYVNPQKILGKIISIFDRKLQIVAVVKDHHQRSLHHPILPTLYDFTGNQKGGEDGFYSVRYHPNVNLRTLNEKIAAIYHNAFPFAAYDTFLIKDFYNRQYKWDASFLRLIQYFMLLSILIGIFGLIGIAMIEITKRTKEIAVRKILGASIPSIWFLIANYFIRLILISILIATPIALFFINNWLQKYTYQTKISWWIFAAAGIGALIITLVTVSFQAIKAAVTNPVKSLKTE